MFLSDSEKSAKAKVLEALQGRLDEMESGKMGSKKEMPMEEMSHDEVEGNEEELYPKEEAAEEDSEMAPEDKATLAALAAKYL